MSTSDLDYIQILSLHEISSYSHTQIYIRVCLPVVLRNISFFLFEMKTMRDLLEFDNVFNKLDALK